jgi:hypothetical protein
MWQEDTAEVSLDSQYVSERLQRYLNNPDNKVRYVFKSDSFG